MSDSIPEQYRPRKCHVVKWPDFQGYGFNLHAEKGKAGQFIGKVDENSPAVKSGLREGDRIVEVNGVNIGNENHQQVVTRIKSGGDETTLLVVDANADNWFKEQKKVIRGDLPDVIYNSAKRDVQVEESPEPEVPPASESPEPEPEPEIVAAAAEVIEQAPVNGDVLTNGDSEHRPRLCHLKIWPTFQGYGFNLHAERDKPGQYIGLVDDNSPASTAGMRVHDRIVEVNGVNVERENHTDVIARIKAVPGEAKLLVVDRESDTYYRDRGVTVSSSMAQTEYIVSPDSAPEEDVEKVEEEVTNLYLTPTQAVSVDVEPEQKQVEEEEERKEEEQRKQEEEEDVIAQFAVVANEAIVQEDEKKQEVEEKREEVEEVREEIENIATFVPPPPPTEDPEPEPEEPVNNGLKSSAPEPPPSEPEYTVASQQQAVEPPPSVAATAPPPPAAKDSLDGLELNMSVSEMKERLKAKKRQDPRLNKISFEQKYKEFQRM